MYKLHWINTEEYVIFKFKNDVSHFFEQKAAADDKWMMHYAG